MRLFTKIMLIFSIVMGQDYTWPTNTGKHLSSNFGEFRTTGYHLGLDIKTKGTVGHPVYAISSGYISRIATNYSGFGRALYLTLDNDQTAVYAHLSKFIPQLEDRLKLEQEQKQSYITNIFLSPEEFKFEKGDIIGVIGKNGAGKSTLLKVLSKITKPTEGRIEINGRIASLLEVGTGFHPELTGRENIFLNGTILGMTRKEVESKFDEIVAFSGIEKFIDTPVKRYSSGMYVRLAFSVAAHLEPEILIIDEVLAVGDAEFQKKCLGKMKDVAGEGRTVIFVSHDIGAVKNLCKKGILLEKGRITFSGDINSVVSKYQSSGVNNKGYSCTDSKKPKYLTSADIINVSHDLTSDESIEFIFEAHVSPSYTAGDRILIRVLDDHEAPLTSFESKLDKESYKLSIPSNYLKKGNYSINVILYQPAVEVYDEVNCCNFRIINNNEVYSHLETFNSGKIYSNESWFQ